MCDKNKKRGISLKDKEAHQEDHHYWSRRNFLRTLGLAGGTALSVGPFSVHAMSSGAAMPLLFDNENKNRILVMIRLKGGNDGLNTIIPMHDYGTYQNARPNIAIPSTDIIRLNDETGIPNSMDAIMPMWNEGGMKVVQSVGYDDHNLSHFTSANVWNSANPDIESSPNKSGWLGRYLLERNPDYLENLPAVPGAIKISSGSNIAFQNGAEVDLAVNFNTPDRLLSIAETGLAYDTETLPNACYYGEQIGFLRTIVNATYQYAPIISEAYNQGINTAEYSTNELSRQLSIVAKLIKGNLGTRLYMVSLNGFDTHENQNQNHPKLLRELTTAVSAFFEDLQAGNRDKQVLAMTFSEFGRRIKENDGGTDHGTAAPVMLFGPSLEGSAVLGENPDLQDVDNTGNLKHSTDFRSIYATILESWMCMTRDEVDHILGGNYSRMSDLGIKCRRRRFGNTLASKTRPNKHLSYADGFGGETIVYNLTESSNVNVSIYAITGQKVATLFDGFQMQGEHSVTYRSSYLGISAAPLVYKIRTNDREYKGKFILQN